MGQLKVGDRVTQFWGMGFGLEYLIPGEVLRVDADGWVCWSNRRAMFCMRGDRLTKLADLPKHVQAWLGGL